MKAIDVLEQQRNDEVLRLEIAYSNLFKAYISGDRDEMVAKYIDAGNVNIPNFTNSVYANTRQTMLSNNIVPYMQPISIYDVKENEDLLRMNVQGCLKALQQELNIRNIYRTQYTYAQNVLYKQAKTFHQDDVLYQKNNGQQLKVADFIAVSKYAVSIAEVIDPSNEDYAKASAAITVLQGIDAILNNKPEDKPINKMLHLVTSFVSSVVKSSVKNDEDKRNVTINSIMVDLVIDFLCER